MKLTILSVVNGDRKLGRRPVLGEVVLQQTLGDTLKVVRVVGDVDRQEADVEDSLALRERRASLVETGGGHDLAESGGETVERLGGASHDEHGRGVEQRDADLSVLGQEGVDLLDVALKGLAAQAVNGEHGGGDTLAVGSGVGDDLGLNGNEREGLLTTESDVEQKLDGLGNVGRERLPRVRGGNSNGGDETLRVAGSTAEQRTKVAGGHVSHLGGNPVLDKLRRANEGERQRDRREVLDGGTRGGSAEPADQVQALRVVGEAVSVGLGGQRLQDLVGQPLEEVLDEGAVDVEQSQELVKVGLKLSARKLSACGNCAATHLVDTLATEQGVELSVTLLRGLEEGRGVRDLDGRVSESLTESGESLEVGGQNNSASLGLVVLDNGENILRAQEELVETLVGRLEDLDELVRGLGSNLVRDEREEAGDKLDLGLV